MWRGARLQKTIKNRTPSPSKEKKTFTKNAVSSWRKEKHAWIRWIYTGDGKLPNPLLSKLWL